MAKTSGGVRTYGQDTSTYRKRQAEVETMRASGRYSSVEMGKGGGYVAIEKSPAQHKPEELEAARILADKGYKVVLKNESGQLRTPDGYLFTASFEQRTPTKDGANTTLYGTHCFMQGIKVLMLLLYIHEIMLSQETAWRMG